MRIVWTKRQSMWIRYSTFHFITLYTIWYTCLIRYASGYTLCHMIRWLGWESILPSNLASLFSILLDLGGGKRRSLRSLWRTWNAHIFSRKRHMSFSWWIWLNSFLGSDFYERILVTLFVLWVALWIHNVGTDSVMWRICQGVCSV